MPHEVCAQQNKTSLDTPESPSSQDLLQRLDSDVLLTLFTALHQERALLDLSSTCKWIRESCKPVLFGCCGVAAYGYRVSAERAFPPRSLWPYIRTLYFVGTFSCTDMPYPTTDGSTPFDPESDIETRCRLAARELGRFVKDMLCSIPHLHTVEVIPRGDEYVGDPWRLPGASWYILDAVLSTPQLRNVLINGQICSPADEQPQDIMTPPFSASLITLKYYLPDHRLQHRANSAEKELRYILARVSSSIEQLELPSEPLPLVDMCLLEWPNLRELALQGERQVRNSDASLLVAMLGKMPHLRSLTLRIAERAGAKPQPVWPPSFNAPYQWRDLEQLTVTHPHSQDGLFARLPRSLVRLVLRCWPRYYHKPPSSGWTIRDAGVRLTPPLLPSSDMLYILRTSDTPNLTHLELEFRGSQADEALFKHIGSSYLRLKVLSIHRYRPDGEAGVPISMLAQAVSQLADLRLLRLHLDYPFLPPITLLSCGVRRGWTPKQEEHIQQALNDARASLGAVADTIARTSPPSLEFISLLLPLLWYGGRQWMTFRVIRNHEADGAGVAQECFHSSIGDSVYGLSIATDD